MTVAVAKDVEYYCEGRSRDTAFARTRAFLISEIFRPFESGVALRFPPQSKMSAVVRSLLPIYQPKNFLWRL